MQLRTIGATGIEITPVAMGCWPITGMTSVGVTESDSVATLEQAVEAGINFFDTAYCYGADGESERLIGRILGQRRDDLVLATKGGIHWERGKQALDARPATLRRECEESLRRLGTDHVDLLYLHAPDPKTPIAESAGALHELLAEGKTRSVGASNLNVEQLTQFAAACPLSAVQPHYNLLQREIEEDVLPWCRERRISVMVYWPLLKGLLAGHLPRDHVFEERDGRKKYPMFQGEEWRRNQDFLDRLRPIAEEAGRTLAQLVINWTIHQPGVTSALCGAKRAEQIHDNAGAMGWRLSEEQQARIAQALVERGPPVSRAAV